MPETTELLGPSEQKHQELRLKQQNKSAQLLSMGASLAIIGLLFSISMLCWRSQCDVSFREGRWVAGVNDTSKFMMCKNAVTRVTNTVSQMTNSEEDRNGIIIDVPAQSCKADRDCSNIPHGFCRGGVNGLSTNADFCEGNSCTCKSIIFDCGARHVIEWSFKPEDYVPECKDESAGNRCGAERKINIPLWKRTRMGLTGLGCEYKQRTALHDAMLRIQGSIQSSGVLQAMHSPDDAKWEPLRKLLSQTSEIKFGSFWPSTISESVSSEFSPEGRIFIGFMICASLCLFSSDYCTHISTVDLPDVKVPIVGFEWNVLRTWLPPLGLVLLAMVQMVPTSEIFGLDEALMTVVHLVGAQFVFVVYLVCEAACLLNADNLSEMKPSEKVLRMILVTFGGICMVTFATVYGTLMLFSGSESTPYVSAPFTGFSDMYYRDEEMGRAYLIRPAEGVWKWMKVVSYFAEYLVAMTILVSHLVICHFFQKRLNESA